MSKFPIFQYPETTPVIVSYVTVFESRHYQLETRDGVVAYEDWLLSEAQRVARAFPCAIVRRKSDRHIALAIVIDPNAPKS